MTEPRLQRYIAHEWSSFERVRSLRRYQPDARIATNVGAWKVSVGNDEFRYYGPTARGPQGESRLIGE